MGLEALSILSLAAQSFRADTSFLTGLQFILIAATGVGGALMDGLVLMTPFSQRVARLNKFEITGGGTYL